MDKLDQHLQREVLLEMVLCYNYGWKQHPEYKYSGTCDICLDNIKGTYVLETPCHHYFDLNCILFSFADFKYLRCPSCSIPYKPIDKPEPQKQELSQEPTREPPKLIPIQNPEPKTEKPVNLTEFNDSYKYDDCELPMYFDNDGFWD
jgi:hypothetical protein